MVRIVSLLLLILGLGACNRSAQTDGVRQGVMDHLAAAGLNMAGMDVKLDSVQINGNQADAAVTIAVKGGAAGQGMPMKYHLEQKDNKWVVVGRQDSSQHGAGAAAPGAANPHGGGAVAAPPPAGGSSKMPSPEDLPPATKKQ